MNERSAYVHVLYGIVCENIEVQERASSHPPLHSAHLQSHEPSELHRYQPQVKLIWDWGVVLFDIIAGTVSSVFL